MQLSDYIVGLTGRAFADLFMVTPPLVAIVQAADGSLSVRTWDASLGTPPTVEQLTAALSAPLPMSQLQASLTAAAQTASSAVVAAIYPTPSASAALQNAAMIVLISG